MSSPSTSPLSTPASVPRNHNNYNLDSTTHQPKKQSVWPEELPLRLPVPADFHGHNKSGHQTVNPIRRAIRDAQIRQNAEADEDMAKYRGAIKQRKTREVKERRASSSSKQLLSRETRPRRTSRVSAQGMAEPVLGLEDGSRSSRRGSENGHELGSLKEEAGKAQRRPSKRGWKGWALVSEDESEECTSRTINGDQRSGQDLGRGKRRRL